MRRKLLPLVAAVFLILAVGDIAGAATTNPGHDHDAEGYLNYIMPLGTDHTDSWFLARGYEYCDLFEQGYSREYVREHTSDEGFASYHATGVDGAAEYLCASVAPPSIIRMVAKSAGRYSPARPAYADFTGLPTPTVDLTDGVPYSFETDWKLGRTYYVSIYNGVNPHCEIYRDGMRKYIATGHLSSFDCSVTPLKF